MADWPQAKSCEMCGAEFQAYRPQHRFCKDNGCQKQRQNKRWSDWKARQEKQGTYRDKVNGWQREFRQRTGYHRDYELRTKYGITLDQWMLMVEEADGVCEICGTSDEALCVDHDSAIPPNYYRRRWTICKPGWDEYYLGIALAVSVRSSCDRRKVGCVAVDTHNRIAGAGYNDSPAGMPGCESCPRRLSGVEPGSSYSTGPGMCLALHAEQNCLLDADRDRLRGGTLYLTTDPCDACQKLIRATGIVRVVYGEPDGSHSELIFDGSRPDGEENYGMSVTCSLGDCVELEVNNDRVWIWSNRRPEEVARIDFDEWSDFVEAVKRGNYDGLGG